MRIDYTLTPDQLIDAIHNTIRIFDKYGLSKKTDKEGRFRITDRSWSGNYLFYVVETDSGCQLSLEAKKIVGKPLTFGEQQQKEEEFLKNLYKVIDKEILITPEIAGTDIYKDKKRSRVMLSIVSLIAVIVLIIIILKAYKGSK